MAVEDGGETAGNVAEDRGHRAALARSVPVCSLNPRVVHPPRRGRLRPVLVAVLGWAGGWNLLILSPLPLFWKTKKRVW